MDWSTIIVAALALIGTLAGSYFTNNRTTAVLAKFEGSMASD